MCIQSEIKRMDMNTYDDILKCISRHEIIEYCLIQVFIFSRGDPWVTQGDCCNFNGGGGGVLFPSELGTQGTKCKIFFRKWVGGHFYHKNI